MKNILSFVCCGALLVGTYGCVKEESPVTNAGAEVTLRPVEKPQAAAAGEVVARLCEGVSEAQLEAMLGRHRLVLGKRSSPTLVTFSWEDERSVEEVIAALLEETGAICAAQPNYRYETLPK